jgi:NitT/TauT family transport system substrate-binding protein
MRTVPKFALAATFVAIATLFNVVGCNSSNNEKKVEANGTTMPIFSLATSEYPSWSTFVVAKKAGLINGTDQGEPGALEKKWGVRIKLEVKDYDPCLTMYAGGTVDAVCMTNIDALNPSLGRPSTVIMPTSTSEGGDKVITVGIDDLAALKGQKTYGLAKSVSEFVFTLGLQKKGLDPKDYPFVNLDPGAAATALQSGSKDVKSVCIWNPFALQTLRSQKNSKTQFDSSVIPETVIDCVVMGNDSLKKEGGEAFAALVCDVYYEVCKRMDNPKSSDLTYKALGEEFSNLGVEDMRIVCKETRFYSNPEAGMKLFGNSDFQKTTMPLVVKTCQTIGILDKDKPAPTIGFNDPSKQLNFDTTFMQKAKDKK